MSDEPYQALMYSGRIYPEDPVLTPEDHLVSRPKDHALYLEASYDSSYHRALLLA